jgi:diguanylate cyclase (GGDEF)-like protein
VGTLAVLTTGAVAGWGLSARITRSALQELRLLSLQRALVNHTGFELLAAVPHSGEYLVANPTELPPLIQADIQQLQTFRRQLDQHLSTLGAIPDRAELHREMEVIRLLSVQLESNLQRASREVEESLRAGSTPTASMLRQTVSDPAIRQIRQHGEQLAALHDQLASSAEAAERERRWAGQLGVLITGLMLLLGWGIGLLLAWRTSDRVLQPLMRLERLMEGDPRQAEAALQTDSFRSAPSEIRSLASSFRDLLAKLGDLLTSLEEQSRTDSLTAVGNRRYFDEQLEREWSRAERSGSALSLLILDIDHFKLYNDHYGHVQGDDCLRRVAAAIRSQLRRSSDVACRIGGEEFAVLLPDSTQEQAAHLGECIVGAIDELAIDHARSGVASQVTASIGVASCKPDRQLVCRQLVEWADLALYRRKMEHGRHGVTMADRPLTL